MNDPYERCETACRHDLAPGLLISELHGPNRKTPRMAHPHQNDRQRAAATIAHLRTIIAHQAADIQRLTAAVTDLNTALDDAQARYRGLKEALEAVDPDDRGWPV